jgi:hypothetical protein
MSDWYPAPRDAQIRLAETRLAVFREPLALVGFAPLCAAKTTLGKIPPKFL